MNNFRAAFYTSLLIATHFFGGQPRRRERGCLVLAMMSIHAVAPRRAKRLQGPSVRQ